MEIERLWGRLTGVRPTKIVHKRLDQGDAPETIVEYLQTNLGLSIGRATLLTQVALQNRPLVPSPPYSIAQRSEVSIYLGIPYCASRCIYCSFPSAILPEDQGQIFSLLDSIGQDIEAVVKLTGEYGLKPRTLYVGGGTPTCLPLDAFRQLMEMVRRMMPFQWVEYTVEAGRPESIDAEKVALMRRFGVTRTSVNPQTMNAITLRAIGRNHSPDQVSEAVGFVRSGGIFCLNMDLIAGLPGEKPEDVKRSLERILFFRPENVTVHTLALKRGTALCGADGSQALVSGEEMREMVEDARETLQNAGYLPYYLYRQKNTPGRLENIGYALPGTEGVYNVDIMEERRTIIGIGPSAATKTIMSADWRLDSCYFPKNISVYQQNLPVLMKKRNHLFERSQYHEYDRTQGYS